MTTPPNTPTRWRPRFSVRTLVVIVTLVCAYAACWGPTKKWGTVDVNKAKGWGTDLVGQPSPTVPLIVAIDNSAFDYPLDPRREYYFWFFGYVAKLPYERDL